MLSKKIFRLVNMLSNDQMNTVHCSLIKTYNVKIILKLFSADNDDSANQPSTSQKFPILNTSN